ncbi:MAG: twin transmembrane helix small protein [Gammaproteobacteria bacterium]|nr:twin transmembrane helix small protein [Gammaproteobacteria bacterium]
MLKTLIAIVFLAIIISLGSGLFALVNDKANSKKLVNSLTVRISLSVLLFVLLIIAYMTGMLQPHDIMPEAPR